MYVKTLFSSSATPIEDVGTRAGQEPVSHAATEVLIHNQTRQQVLSQLYVVL